MQDQQRFRGYPLGFILTKAQSPAQLKPTAAFFNRGFSIGCVLVYSLESTLVDKVEMKYFLISTKAAPSMKGGENDMPGKLYIALIGNLLHSGIKIIIF